MDRKPQLPSSVEIKELLGISHCYFLNFELKDAAQLRNSMLDSAGFVLGRIYNHPRRKDIFILCLNPTHQKNKGLNFNRLTSYFSINNTKRVSPKLFKSESITVEEFEEKNQVYLGRPKSKKGSI